MYYGNIHHVWCATSFNAKGNPPSSNPLQIYNGLKKDIDGADLHSAKIAQNKVGILKGAKYKRDKGIISDSDFRDIKLMVKMSGAEHFRPLIYVINMEKVSTIVERASIRFKANMLSDEHIIKELSHDFFDVIELEGVI